jgi:hypothetical protein
VFNAQTGTYSVHRVPKRTLDEVTKSIGSWKHQDLADESTADYSAEDGILSMECSACGLTRPSAIELAAVDLDTVMAYEAGSWHVGIHSKDGTQDFFGVLRGELGPGTHDTARVSDDQRIALTALVDMYDLAYLTQSPPGTESAAGAQRPTGAGKASKAGTNSAAPVAAQSPKPTAISLETLAANGDVTGIQARRTKTNSRELATALERAYAVRARSQMLEGQVDAALQTLAAGRQSFGKSAALRDREAHYVVIGDLYDRLRLAVKLQVAEVSDYLRQIQTLEAEDATSIGQMLARTLSNRIADLRAAGRTTVAADLVSSGEELFPAWADQLTRGTAGALPQAGVNIDTADVPTSAAPK